MDDSQTPMMVVHVIDILALMMKVVSSSARAAMCLPARGFLSGHCMSLFKPHNFDEDEQNSQRILKLKVGYNNKNIAPA